MSNKVLCFGSGFPRAILNNGIGRYICQLKRITIKFCKHSGDSRGMREFIERDMLDFCNKHPEVVVYLKPRRNHAPVVVAEYLNGERKYHNFHKYGRLDIMKWVNLMRTRSGRPVIRYRKLWHTEMPSIQGVWNPFTNRDPTLNIATFPLERLSRPAYHEPTATDELVDLFRKTKIKEEQEANLKQENIEIPIQN